MKRPGDLPEFPRRCEARPGFEPGGLLQCPNVLVFSFAADGGRELGARYSAGRPPLDPISG